MSTKNLARSVIEGGRRHQNQEDRWHSNASERAWERLTSHRLLTATELDDVIYRPRRKVYRDFSDKLAPAARFLASQVGRPWSKVRGELFARFDIRTTAGRHILFDHVLKSVHEGYGLGRRCVFFIDAHGILRGTGRRRKRFPRRNC